MTDYTDLPNAVQTAIDAGASVDQINDRLAIAGKTMEDVSIEASSNQSVPTTDIEVPVGEEFEEHVQPPQPVVESGGISNVFPNQMDILAKSIAEATPTRSEAYVRDQALELMMLRLAKDPGADRQVMLEQAEMDVRSAKSIHALFQSEQNNYSAKRIADAYNAIKAEVDSNPYENLQLYEEPLQKLGQVDTLFDGLAGRQAAFQDMYSKESALSRNRREQEAEGLAYAELKNLMEERGDFGSMVSDIGGILLDPIYFTLDANELGKLVGSKEVNPYKALANIISTYQVADPELKKQIFPSLLLKFNEATDNNSFKTAGLVAMLHDPEYTDELAINAAFDAAGPVLWAATGGVGAMATNGTRLLKTLQKGLSLRQKLKKAGNTEEAVKSAKNKDTLQEAMDADAHEWESTQLGVNATDGLAGEYQGIADTIKADVSKPMAEMMNGNEFIKVAALTSAEKEAAAQAKLNEALNVPLPNLVNAKIKSIDDSGYKIEYTFQDPTRKVTAVQEFTYKLDDVGSYIATNESLSESALKALGSNIFSPEVMLRSLSDDIISETTFAEQQSANLRRSLVDVWQKTEKGLSKDSSRAVSELLLAGDESKQVFKIGDLLAGNIQTSSGKRKFTKAEATAYYSKIEFIDRAHDMQNHIVRSKLDFENFKEISWVNHFDNTGVKSIAKPLKDGRHVPTDPETSIYVMGVSGKNAGVVRRGSLNIEERMSQGFTPVRFLEPQEIDGKRVLYALMPDSPNFKVSQLPKQVLNKNPGYVPRIRKPGYHYVKDVNTGHTIAFFAKKENAQAWANDFMRVQAQDGSLTEAPKNLQVFRDRDLSAQGAFLEDVNTYGGLYTGARSKVDLIAGDDLAGEVTRLSTGQSIERMVDAVSSIMPLNEYRMGMVDRYKNTLETMLKNQGIPSDSLIFRQLNDAQGWKDMDLGILKNNTEKAVMENLRRYLFDTLRVPNNKENSWNNFMMTVSDYLPAGKANKAAVWLASKDPISALKGATFNAYLGWFNPRQLYIQAQNAAIAMSMHPTEAPAALTKAMAQRLFLYTPTIDKELLAKASKGLLKPGEVSDMALSLEQFKRSGLRESIMRSGDYGAVAGGFTNGTLDGMQRLASKGRIFYEEGESMARLVSWNIARNRWIKANPGKDLDDDAIKFISKDVIRMNMNMQRTNAAAWQKNPIVSIPTQFLQVQAKLVENTLGGIFGKGPWTKAEAYKVFAGQIVLYGTMGVPFLESLVESTKGTVYEDPMTFNVENPVLAKAVDQGSIGVLAHILGIDVNFSTSASIIAGLDDNAVVDIIKATRDVISGETRDISFSAPAFSVTARISDAVINTFEAAKTVVAIPTLETAGDSLLKSIDSIAAITSTWSNARKIAFLNHIGGITDKKGNLIISAENLEGTSFQTLMAKAMGMPLNIEEAYYKQKLFRLSNQEKMVDAREGLKIAYRNFALTGNRDVFNATSSALLSEFDNQPLIRNDIINTTLESILTSESAKDRETSRLILDFVRTGGVMQVPSHAADLIPKE